MKAILFISIMLNSNMFFAQSVMKFETIDSISKTQNQIYSDTKMFIAKTWKSAKDVIQNDDKEGGLIMIKGSHTKTITFMMVDYIYIYNYDVIFRMKNNKFKITLDNVNCEYAFANLSSGKTETTKIQPFLNEDDCTETGTFAHPGLPKRKAILMMAELRDDLKSIVVNYNKEIKTASISEW